jgi:uncharacterized protein YbaA (DUF1428 family)
MPYVDGFAAAVPTARKDAYIEHCRIAAAVFRDAGALRVVDGWGDDVPDGILTSFPMAVKRQADETVAIGWVLWPDKATRDAGWARAMADPRMSAETNPMPFDGKRLIFGGFELFLDI